MKNLKAFNESEAINESEGFFSEAYDVDDYRWKSQKNKDFIFELVTNLLEISRMEDGNINRYIEAMSKDKQELLIKIGNLIYKTDK
jgi:hypothetical protein